MLSLTNAFENVELAKRLLKAFVQHFSELYGSRHLVYNVHSLLHLPDDVARYGKLDHFSAFPFENYLGSLKKMLRKPNYALSQVVNRLHEKKSLTERTQNKDFPSLKISHNNGPLLKDGDPSDLMQYKVLHLRNFTIKLDRRNRGIMVDNKVGEVVNILQNKDKDIYILYQYYKEYKDLYTYPLKSGSFGIYMVGEKSNKILVCSYKKIQQKYIIFPCGNKVYAFPLLNSTSQQF